MFKKLTAVMLMCILALIVLSGCYFSYTIDNNRTAYPDSDTYFDSQMPYYGDYNNYARYYDDTGYSNFVSNIILVFFGYIIPVIFIILSLVFYYNSKSERRTAWFIMTGVGLALSVLTTLFIIFSM